MLHDRDTRSRSHGKCDRLRGRNGLERSPLSSVPPALGIARTAGDLRILRSLQGDLLGTERPCARPSCPHGIMETSLLNVSPMRKSAIPGPMRLAISSLGFRQNRRFGSYPNAEISDRVERSINSSSRTDQAGGSSSLCRRRSGFQTNRKHGRYHAAAVRFEAMVEEHLDVAVQIHGGGRGNPFVGKLTPV